jgi:hypothetical protein
MFFARPVLTEPAKKIDLQYFLNLWGEKPRLPQAAMLTSVNLRL